MNRDVELSGGNVLVAFIPDWTRERVEALRDHIAESVGISDAVLPEGTEYRVDKLRDLCLGLVKLGIEDWRRIGKALDKLESKERKVAGNV